MAQHSSDFCTTLATIAALAVAKEELDPQDAVNFAWASVNERGDASVDEDDLERHLTLWYLDGALTWRRERRILRQDIEELEAAGCHEAVQAQKPAQRRLNRLIARADDLADTINPYDL